MIQPDRLLETFLSILRINSYYPNEDPVADVLRSKLEPVGVQLTKDEHRNMLGYLPGSGSLAAHDPVLLCAHMEIGIFACAFCSLDTEVQLNGR